MHTFIAYSALMAFLASPAVSEPGNRTYANRLTLLKDPRPILADHPDFVAPVVELTRYESPPLVTDSNADLHVRAWRYSYNARGIIEIPNQLSAAATAVIMVHPWGIDDGQGWKTPEPAGVCDFCTPAKNAIAGRHTREVIAPLLKSLRGKAAFIMYSIIGEKDPIRSKLYRDMTGRPSETERRSAVRQLSAKLGAFNYCGRPLPQSLSLSEKTPVADYFRQFPGLDAGPGYNGAGFWELPVPVSSDAGYHPDDIVIYDVEGYRPLRDFLKKHNVRHVLLTGYATDMCFRRTTAGFENLSRDFNVFLVGDATLATFPANMSPRHATNAAISFAALDHLITQVSWIRYQPGIGKKR